jgi:hypothetical protein
MKRLISFLLCAVFLAILVSGCVSVDINPGWTRAVRGRGTPETFSFDTGEIREIRVEMLCNIEFYSAPSDTVTLNIQPNLLELITVAETDGVLTVRSRRSINFGSGTNNANIPVLTVSSPALTRLDFAGAGTFTAKDVIVADSFTINMTGAGAGRAELDVEKLNVTLSGAGDFILSGRADTAELKMSGAGRLDALSLEARDADINISGVGQVRIHCTENLRIVAGGVGQVEYRGSPSVDISRGGLVSVRKVD